MTGWEFDHGDGLPIFRWVLGLYLIAVGLLALLFSRRERK